MDLLNSWPRPWQNLAGRSRDALLAFFSPWRLFLTGAVVLLLRVPYLLREPRIWAEEGSFFFSGAWNTPGWRSLVAGYHLGYYPFYTNAVALLTARWVPLEYAPAALMLAAWCIQLLPIALVCFGQSDLWSGRGSRVVAVAIILFTRISGEIWLNTITGHFHLSLVTFLLLLESFAAASVLKRWITRLLLCLAASTGVVSLFFAPLFAYVWWRERQRERLIQCGILAAGAGLQLYFLLRVGVPGGRFNDLDGYTYPSLMLTKYFAVPLLGTGMADAIGARLSGLKAQGGAAILAVTWSAFALQAGFWLYLARGCTPVRRVVWVGGLLLSTVLTYVSMFSPKWDSVNGSGLTQRYFYVPNVILLLLLASAAAGRDGAAVGGKLRRSVASIVLAGALAGGVAEYRSTALATEDWPRWSEELRRWREDPRRPINLWPPGWQMQLDAPPPPAPPSDHARSS